MARHLHRHPRSADDAGAAEGSGSRASAPDPEPDRRGPFDGGQDPRGSADLGEFRAAFRDRLEALSRVQGLLSLLDENDRVTFDELIRAEMAVLDGAAERVTLSGPLGVRLRSSMA
ncbi:HWE histidine kinase domain-containing protein [Muricoccus aerilatus]|uniref:HWE histidine kinase domain-containing protein n=1 Tax=Muricoccus aerilatus TaxID=452982 RepID=UPI001B806F8F|nr:HWE histidine kinase domain-containing protein [Roseomonas aerilata]